MIVIYAKVTGAANKRKKRNSDLHQSINESCPSPIDRSKATISVDEKIAKNDGDEIFKSYLDRSIFNFRAGRRRSRR